METIEENKKNKFLSRAGETVKKVVFVFQSDFAVAAGFAVLLFLLASAWIVGYEIVLDDIPVLQEIKFLAFSNFAAVLGSTFCVFFLRNKSKKIIHIGAAISGAISFVIARLFVFTEGVVPPSDYWGFLLLLLMLFMFAVYSGEKKNESLLFVFSKFINSIIIAHIIFVGFVLCYFVLFECIFDIYAAENIYLVVSYAFSLCIVGLFYFFSSLNTDSAKNPPLAKIEKGWYHYCLAPIFTVYIELLYVYLLKIIFTWKLPEGKINIFVSIATAAYLFMYFSQRQFDDRFTKIFYRFGKFFILPLVVLQVISICVRVSYYGFTASRVCSIGYVLVFILFILMDFFKKEQVGKIFLVGAGAILILVIKPINISKRISVSSQTKTMEKLLVKYGMLSADKTELHQIGDVSKISFDDMKRISSCYNYLMEKDLPSYFVKDGFEENFGFQYVSSGGNEDFAGVKEYYWSRDLMTIDMTEFNWLTEGVYSYYGNDDKEKNTRIVVDNIKTSTGRTIEYDFTDFLLSNCPYDENAEYKIEIDENTTILIRHINIFYSHITKRFIHVMVTYYVLEK